VLLLESLGEYTTEGVERLSCLGMLYIPVVTLLAQRRINNYY